MEQSTTKDAMQVNTSKADDAASEVLGDVITAQVNTLSPEEDRRILRKIDFRLLPALAFSYMLQYLDKSAMGFTAILGLRDDLHLVGQDYSWATSFFYFGYLFGSFLAARLLVRLQVGKFLAGSMGLWAAILMLMSTCTNASGLWAARFFLGAVEAAMAPGMALIIGMWYKRSEQPVRQAAWFMGNVIGGTIGGVLAYGVGHVNGIAPWKGLFLIFGGITVFWSIIAYFIIPDTPMTARFLRQEERAKAIERVQENLTGIKSYEWKWEQAKEAVLDPKLWFMFFFQIAQTIPNCVGTFASIIISGFGFSTFDTLLVQMIGGGFQIVFVAMSAIGSSKIKNSRTYWMALMSAFALTGSVMIRYIDASNHWGRFMGYCLVIAFSANFPLTFALVTSNTCGFTKKSVSTSMILIGYTIGNIVGPQLMFDREAPSYPSGFAAILVCLAVSILIILSLRVYLILENKRRDREGQITSDFVEVDGVAVHISELNQLDKTDYELKQFRYVY